MSKSRKECGPGGERDRGAGERAEQAGADESRQLLALMLPFILFFNVVAFFTWGYGILSFCMLAATVVWVVVAPRFLMRLGGRRRIGSCLHDRRVLVLSWSLIAVFLTLHVISFVQAVRDPRSQVMIVDIGANTYLASEQLFARGRNPYSERCQIWHEVSGAPHVVVGPASTTMYGVPYYYGYPYFPVMFAAFAPWQAIIHNYNAIRVGNGFLFLLTIVLLLALAWSNSGTSRSRVLAGTLSVLLFSAILQWGSEIFFLGVTDVVISVLLLGGFLCLSHQRHVSAGILFGLAMGCKLLPAPLVLVFTAIWLKRQGHPVRGMIVASLLTAAATTVPFLVWNPPAFLSATILYYLTYHSIGDNTSLWFFLPSWGKSALSVLGPALIVLCLCFALRSRDQRLSYPARMAFISYVLFVACSRMTHLNYLWSIFSVGAFAFAAEAVDAWCAPRLVDPSGRIRLSYWPPDLLGLVRRPGQAS